MNRNAELIELQETIYASRNPTRRWLHCIRRDWIRTAIKRYGELKNNGCALEVGPGSGVYLADLAQYFAVVVASDVEEAYLDNAQRLAQDFSNIVCKKDDITQTRMESEVFDLILCTEVIEHIVDSEAALANMRKLLKPSGVLILSTPQRYSPIELVGRVALLPGLIQITRLVYREPVLPTGHINLLTEKSVRRQLELAGFCIDAAHKSGLYIPLLAEFGGSAGLCVERELETKLRRGSLSWLLWTQYYVARPSAG